MSNQCRWLHDWGKWEFVEQKDFVGDDRSLRLGVIIMQRHECNRCGYSQTKMNTVLNG